MRAPPAADFQEPQDAATAAAKDGSIRVFRGLDEGLV
jgi:hypothetical protein